MATQVALVYKAAAVGPVSLTQLETAMAAVAIPYTDVLSIGLTLKTDVTAIVGSNVVRTITYSITPPLTIFTPQSAPGTFQGSIVSSNAFDNADNGVTPITIYYTDSNNQPQYETVQLNGSNFVNLLSQTKVTITSIDSPNTGGMVTIMSGLNGTGVLIANMVANFQGSIVSSSPNDTATGIGARTVTITYHNASGGGPFTETIALNGTTPVSLVNFNKAVINNMVVASTGSYGSSTGTIQLYSGLAVNDPSIGPPTTSGALVAYLGASFYQYFPPQTTIAAGLIPGGNLNAIPQVGGGFTTVPALTTIGNVVNADQAAPLRDIYTHIFGASLLCPIVVNNPVFS